MHSTVPQNLSVPVCTMGWQGKLSNFSDLKNALPNTDARQRNLVPSTTTYESFSRILQPHTVAKAWTMSR